MELFIIAMIVLVLVASTKVCVQSYYCRKHKWYSKVIYNVKGKSTAQILTILKLECEENIDMTGLEIDGFSKPIYRKDGSAEYVVYLKEIVNS
jgi:hypothetical protein